MALITASLAIPDVGRLFPLTRRWRQVRPCGTAAAYRRHYRRREPVDVQCARWHRDDMRARRQATLPMSGQGQPRREGT